MNWLVVIACLVGVGLIVLASRVWRRSQETQEMQGEGNREADRRYREHASRFARSGRVEDAAQEARDALDDPAEVVEMEQAEREIRRHSSR